MNTEKYLSLYCRCVLDYIYVHFLPTSINLWWSSEKLSTLIVIINSRKRRVQVLDHIHVINQVIEKTQ